MADASSRRRKPAAASDRKPVRISVPIDADTYIRLAAAAAMRGCTHGALVAELVQDHLRGVVVFDKRAKSDDSATPDVEVNRPDAA